MTQVLCFPYSDNSLKSSNSNSPITLNEKKIIRSVIFGNVKAENCADILFVNVIVNKSETIF